MGSLSLLGVLLVMARSIVSAEVWEANIPAHLVFSGAMSLLLILSLAAVNSCRKPRERRRNLTARVADQGDVRSIGALIDALSLADTRTHTIALDAICERLPLLKTGDETLLTKSQCARLSYLLSLPVESPLHKDIRALFRPADQRSIDLRVAILQAFEQIGDSKVLPVVTQLVSRKPGTIGERRIHEAAVSCLAALQLRQEQARSSQTLLRASHLAPAASDTLLRPAEGSQETSSAELLRADVSPS